MGNTNLDIDYQTTDEEVGSSEVRKADLKKFIDELPHLDEVDKYWARKDMPQLLAEGVDVQDIKDKYSFYDHLAEMQNEMFKNVPKEKQEEIRNVIRRVTSKESKGKDRDAKLEHVLRIKKTIEALHEKQINLKFLVEEKVLSGDVHFGVVEILNASEPLLKLTPKIYDKHPFVRFGEDQEEKAIQPEIIVKYCDAVVGLKKIADTKVSSSVKGKKFDLDYDSLIKALQSKIETIEENLLIPVTFVNIPSNFKLETFG